MPIEKPVPFLQNTSGSVIDNHHEAHMAAQHSIARGYDDLANGRVRTLGNKQRQRQIGCEPSGKVTSPHVTIL